MCVVLLDVLILVSAALSSKQDRLDVKYVHSAPFRITFSEPLIGREFGDTLVTSYRFGEGRDTQSNFKFRPRKKGGRNETI